MALNKTGAQPTDPGMQFSLGNPRPQYIPLADVAFGPLQPVLPHALPPTSMVFPNITYNQMAFPGVHVLYDAKRNGVAF